MSKANGMSGAARVRACPLCEAGCGLSFGLEEGRAVSVRPDAEDVLSKGFVCPKGMEILNLEHDPDRLTQPVRRSAGGAFVPITWDEAFGEVADRLRGIRASHGADAVAMYMGTVLVHKYQVALLRGPLQRALGTRNCSSASSQDTGARFAAAFLMYGSAFSLAVPDIDRTAFMLCIGANPAVSNGSLMTAPNARGRLAAITQRGGKLVVVDPRRSETARLATEHISIRPGTDAALLLAMVHTLVREQRVDRARLAREATGWPELEKRLERFSPERVESYTSVPRDVIERLALEFAAAPSSVAYSRMGPGNSRHATLACYAVELLNLVAGRLGQVGGAMFATPAVDLTRVARLTDADGFNRYRSRVRGLPETIGDLPATTLAEEIETPGPGQVRALLTYAGNPVSSVPNGRRLDRALSRLELMVSIDMYVNETTRHAHIILPPAPSLAEDHADLFFANVAVHNGMRWTEPVLEALPHERLDWQILLELIERLGGGITGLRPVDAALRASGVKLTPAHLLTAGLRLGPYGDHFLPWSRGLNRKRLAAAPHGIDLGPLEPGYRRRVFHPGGRVELGTPILMEAMDALAKDLAPAPADELLLIGRRSLRSNNSWMHNVPRLVAGKARCVLFVHPRDAERVGAVDGGAVTLESRVHRGAVTVHVTDEVRPGVVSLPHGYGQGALGQWQKVSAAHAGVSANDWVDDAEVETVAGQSILNGVAVRLYPAAP